MKSSELLKLSTAVLLGALIVIGPSRASVLSSENCVTRKPAGAIRPRALSSSTLATLIALQLLVGLRGVKRFA